MVDLAAAAVTALNAGSFSQAFTAVRKYQPRWKRDELANLRVTVVPRGDDRDGTASGGARNEYQEDLVFEVGVQKQYDATNDVTELATCDALAYLFEEVKDFLGLTSGAARRFQLDSGDHYCWIRTENVNPDHFWVEAHQQDLHVFTAVARFFYRGFQESS